MDEDDIAAAMGFSSFGGTKKRKLDQRNSPSAKADASGANSTRLGVRPKISELGNQKEEHCQRPKVAGDHENILETIEAAQSPEIKGKGKQKQPAATSLADFLTRGHSLPDKTIDTQPASHSNAQEQDPSSMVSFGGQPISKAELNALRQGVKNGEGDVAYFLPSFVEDPWEIFEKSRT